MLDRERILIKIDQIEGYLRELREILPDDFATFRNILVHEYARLDDKIVHEIARTRLDDFATFKREILSCLKVAE